MSSLDERSRGFSTLQSLRNTRQHSPLDDERPHSFPEERKGTMEEAPAGMMIRFFLVRHGEAETNLIHAIGRNNSSPLTPTGILLKIEFLIHYLITSSFVA